MSNYMKAFGFLLLAPLILAAATAAAAPQTGTQNVPVTTVVTVLGPNYTAPPALGKSDVVVHTGNRREDVVSWDAAQGEKFTLDLAIVIDDLSNINNQLDDIRKFINAPIERHERRPVLRPERRHAGGCAFQHRPRRRREKSPHHPRLGRSFDQHLSFFNGGDEEISFRQCAARNSGHRRRH